jgi:hypothetical protein
VICFTEVRFLETYSPLRRSQRLGLFQPFPSLKRSPRTLSRWRTVHLLQTTVGAVVVAPHGTPDSPLNYSGVALQKPEAEQFRVDLPGAPDTVQWHTGQSGAPDQGSLRLVLLLSF